MKKWVIFHVMMYGLLLSTILYFANAATTYYSMARDLETLNANALLIVNQSNKINQMQNNFVNSYADVVGHCTNWDLSETALKRELAETESIAKDRDAEFDKLESLFNERQSIGDKLESINLR